MKPKSRWLIPVLGGVLLIAGSTAFACGGADRGMMKGGRSEHMAARAVYQLDDLSAEQRDKLDALFDAQRDTMRARMDAQREDRHALRDALQADADPQTIRPLAKRMGEHMAEMIVLRAEQRQKLNAILTEAQQKQLTGLQRGRGGSHRKHGW